MSSLVVIILCCAAVYLVALGVAALVAPAVAARFLTAFATSPRAHLFEMAIRLAVGGALLVHALAMPWSKAWLVLGWLLVGTSLALLAIPWRWHRAFAARSVPRALRFITPLGLVSTGFGGLLLYATLAGQG